MKTALFIFSFLITSFSWQTAMAEGLLKYENPVPIPHQLTWESGDGKKISINDFKGKVILLNIWATWCGPCVFELPMFDFLQKRYGKSGFEVVAVSGDDSKEQIETFFNKHNVNNLKTYTNQGKWLQKAFNIQSLPATYLVNRNGEIIAGKEGLADWLGDDFTNQLKEALRESLPKQHTEKQEVIESDLTFGIHR